MFYIYDSRAVAAMSKLSDIVGRASEKTVEADNEYRKFADKCVRLQQHVQEHFEVGLTPREIDNLPLEMYTAQV